MADGTHQLVSAVWWLTQSDYNRFPNTAALYTLAGMQLTDQTATHSAVDAAIVANVLMHGLVHVSTLLCVACVMVWYS